MRKGTTLQALKTVGLFYGRGFVPPLTILAGDWCFCGKSAPDATKVNRNSPQPGQMNCKGNPNQQCGGFYLLAVYDMRTDQDGCLLSASPPQCGPTKASDLTTDPSAFVRTAV
jgi:hypothetical protein